MLDVTVNQGSKSCWFWHKWNVVAELEVTQYMICEKCHTRRIYQNSHSYQPVNWDWVEGETNVVNENLK